MLDATCTILYSVFMNLTEPFFVLNVQFKPDEVNAIMNDFNEPGSLAPTGLFLAAAKYMVIQGEPGAVIRGKKVSNTHIICIML